MTFDKIHFIKFAFKKSPQIDSNIGYDKKLIPKAHDTKFLRLCSDSTQHIKQTAHKIKAACNALKSVTTFRP